MDLTEKRHWPFEVLPTERRSEQHRREIGFLERAHQAGYRPYTFGSQNFGAADGERTGEIICRGCRGTHWEVCLWPFGLTAHVDDFDRAAEADLRWLQGFEAIVIAEELREHLFMTGATSPGLVLHCPAPVR